MPTLSTNYNPRFSALHWIHLSRFPYLNQLLLALLAGALLTATAACGGKSAAPPPDTAAPAHVGTTPGALPALPAPSTLPHTASAPPTNGDRFRSSPNYWPGVAKQRATAVHPGDDLTFSPDWDALAPDSSGLAYAAYLFTNMTEYSGMSGIRIEWLTPPADYGNLFFALADYDDDAWRWFPGSPSGFTPTPNLADFISGTGELVVLVLLTGTDEAELGWLIAGERLGIEALMISDLNPDAALNIAPQTIVFDANPSWVYGGTITTFDFDFEDDGTFDVTGNTDGTESYLYNAPGSHTCRVRVHDDGGQQGETTITFWLVNQANVPPTADIQALPANGAAPLPVTLDAGGTTDDSVIVSYEWDLDEDGAFELNTGAVETVDHIFAKNGLNTVTVRVTDDDFATDTASVGINLSNGFGYQTIATDQSINDRIAMLISSSGVNARPCVAWQDYPTRKLMFSRSVSKNGDNWAAPLALAPPNDQTGFSPCMVANISGRPVVAYGKFLGSGLGYHLQTIHFTNDDCTIWNGPYDVNAVDDVGGLNAMTRNNSVPAIISVTKFGYSGQNSIRYYLATDTDGTAWNPGIEIMPAAASTQVYDLDLIIATNGMTQFLPLAAYCLGGNVTPAIGTIHATAPDGSTWDGPVQFEPYFADTVSLQSSNLTPNLACGSGGQTGQMHFNRADDSLGAAWSSTPVELTGAGYGGLGKMRIVNARPAICYYSFEGGDIWYIEAADSEGTTWNDPYIVASAGRLGPWCSMVVVDNTTPVIAYFDDENNKLMCAYWTP